MAYKNIWQFDSYQENIRIHYTHNYLLLSTKFCPYRSLLPFTTTLLSPSLLMLVLCLCLLPEITCYSLTCLVTEPTEAARSSGRESCFPSISWFAISQVFDIHSWENSPIDYTIHEQGASNSLYLVLVLIFSISVRYISI